MVVFVEAERADHPKIQEQFYILRAKAIEKYSELEQELCSYLAFFTGTEPLVAATIFFKITASRSRREILDKLKKQKVGVKYSLYWVGALELSGKLDEQRNQIVHWAVTTVVRDSVLDPTIPKAISITLMPPPYWRWIGDPDDPDAPEEISAADMELFSRKCEFLRLALLNFRIFLADQMPSSGHATWREIFQQRLVYPPIPDHPLYQRPIEP
jgi:hypothetical protein